SGAVLCRLAISVDRESLLDADHALPQVGPQSQQHTVPDRSPDDGHGPVRPGPEGICARLETVPNTPESVQRNGRTLRPDLVRRKRDVTVTQRRDDIESESLSQR